MKAQLSADYLVILAVLMLLALLSLGILGYFPDIGKNLQAKASYDFWQNQARPIAVMDAIYRQDENRIYFALKSHSQEQISIKKLFVNSTQLALFRNDATGEQLCDEITCKVSPCDCDFEISPFGNASAFSELYAEDASPCGENDNYFLEDFSLFYTNARDSSDTLQEKGYYLLAITCG
ncbi:hypothetical protein COU37_03585 [Candidatus Micrarchaeota archaeon CG10_big_fil_rev_8_21_14_0_10_45_29]|nr:MAG: hypothetical protein COU37_03585 [Candidatus Micrarchaeota archaeon CG10_big_fil_rev_8_21_14_0_10_45_29]